MSNRSSDIGRLFRRRASLIEPIENFVSEALAIAIAHDDAPMRAALGRVYWPTEQPKALDEVVRITGARTQVLLPAAGQLGHGYLDLVLDIQQSDGSAAEAWIEVKVEASEHGEQLDLYANHVSPISRLTAIAPRRPFTSHAVLSGPCRLGGSSLSFAGTCSVRR